MENLARKNILQIKPYQPGKPIGEVKRQYGIERVIKLASNENPLGPSPKAVLAVKKELKRINLYPDGGAFYLRKKLAADLKIGTDCLVFGNGSNEIIELILKAFLHEKERVIVNKPDFLVYKLAVLQEAGEVVEVPLKNFKCDLEAVKKKIDKKTKIIFIANPNNPVGTYVGRKDLENFLRNLPRRIIVVLDEAYFEFAEERDYPNGIDYINSNNIIVLRTFSKAYGLAGLRIGYGVARPYFINCLNKARQPFNVNSLAQTGALAALSDKIFLEATKRTIRDQKQYLYAEFRKLGVEFIQSAANFILFKCAQDGRVIFEKFIKEGVIVRDMKAYGLDEWIRVTIGKFEENQKFIRALKKISAL